MPFFLDESSRELLVCVRTLSRLDYCNSLLLNLSNEILNRLERCHNNAARLVMEIKRKPSV